MAEVNKVRRKSNSPCLKVLTVVRQKKKGSKALKNKEWEDATCSVCMEYPHNAVLLLCSSYNKGCRPYMCATSNRYSNCLEQYKKAYTKVTSTHMAEPLHGLTDDLGFSPGIGCVNNEKKEVSELLCPLCRCQVKGWTVVELARKYFNTKKRTCMQDNCSFVGTYKQLRKHVRAQHPWARPREVDPSLAEKWKRLEREREREDVISTIRSSTPGAIVMGDYVIERNYRSASSGDFDMDDYLGDAIFRLESWDGEDDEMHQDGTAAVSGHFGNNYISRLTGYRGLVMRRTTGRLRGQTNRAANGR
ncbi:hypothetical protein LOK49_LG08G01674 [Camellia lanceoleosa]|uniref:Uncharacterized protein n=1 Tax=Camellia lanceoleosa TaxID=1840588 RepID=A0ACC0GW50_9ERIC|nr:hypothetical protein LOK49_LG08G01674 [Camellia lanceoleosa]